jgi:hypothetical protein
LAGTVNKPAARLPIIDLSPPALPWTAHEDERLRTLYPRYDLLRVALPHRSLSALKHRVRRLGIVRRRHIWTNLEIRRLHEAFENHVPDRELEALFPGLGLGQIKAKAGHIRAPHRRSPQVIFGVRALDAIRQRARAQGLSNVELDRRARTGKFFQKSRRQPMLKQIARAAVLLGGELCIVWRDFE